MAGLHIAERPRHSTFFHRVWRPTLGPPFASLLGSHKELIVDLAGRCVDRCRSSRRSRITRLYRTQGGRRALVTERLVEGEDSTGRIRRSRTPGRASHPRPRS
jgi:hypothetical protein